MRKMSEERRKIAVLAAVVASTSSSAMTLMHGHSRAVWVWAGAEMVVLGILIARVVRLRMKGDCA